MKTNENIAFIWGMLLIGTCTVCTCQSNSGSYLSWIFFTLKEYLRIRLLSVAYSENNIKSSIFGFLSGPENYGESYL